MGGFGLKLYKPKPVSFSQDSQGLFLRVKVVQIQRCHFGGPGPGIIEQMKEGVIPEPLFSFQINGLENLQDLILIKKPNERLLNSLLRYIKDGIRHLLLFWIFEADHFGKGFEGCKPLIASLGQVLSLMLKIFKKSNN
jgi:hypothetical protein